MNDVIINYSNGRAFVDISFNLKYETQRKFTVHEVIDALSALDPMANATSDVINKLLYVKSAKGLRLKNATIFVKKLEEGSWTEDVLIRFFFGSKEEMEKQIDRIRKNLKIDKIMNDKVVTCLIMLVALNLLFQSCSKESNNPVHIEINNSGFLSIGSEALGMQPDQLLKIVETSVKSKPKKSSKNLQNAALKLFAPIENDNGNIVLNNDEALVVNGSEIGVLPKEVKIEPDLDILEFSNIEVFIRALDRDKTESGWSAIIPSLSPKRIKLKISSKIDLKKLASKESIIGSGIAEYEKLEGGKRRYKEYILMSIK